MTEEEKEERMENIKNEIYKSFIEKNHEEIQRMEHVYEKQKEKAWTKVYDEDMVNIQFHRTLFADSQENYDRQRQILIDKLNKSRQKTYVSDEIGVIMKHKSLVEVQDYVRAYPYRKLAKLCLAFLYERDGADDLVMNDLEACCEPLKTATFMDLHYFYVKGYGVLGKAALKKHLYKKTIDVAKEGQQHLKTIQKLYPYMDYVEEQQHFVSLLATAYLKLGEQKKAQQKAQELLTLNNKSIIARRILADILENQQDSEAAICIYQEILDLSPNDHESLYAIARLQLAANTNLDTIKGYMEKATGLANKATYWRLLAQIQMALKEVDAAYANFVKSIKCSPRLTSDNYTQLGLICLHEKKNEKSALSCFERALLISSDDQLAGQEATRLYKKTKTADQLEAFYLKHMERSMNAIWAVRGTAFIKLAKDQLDESAHLFQLVLRSTPKDVYVWEGLAECYSRQGKLLAALKAFHQVMTMKDDDLIRCHIGELHIALGNMEIAESMFQRLMETKGKQDDHVQFLINYGYLKTHYVRIQSEIEHGHYSLAKTHLKEVIHIISEPTRRVLVQLLADVYALFIYFPRDDTSVVMIKKAIEMYEQCKESHRDIIAYNQGVLASFLDDPRAETYFKEAIRESNQALYWNALGEHLPDSAWKRKQHCFLMAIKLSNDDATSGVAWANYGLLAMRMNNDTLARKALSNSQNIYPNLPESWFGLGMLLFKEKDERAHAILAQGLSLCHYASPEGLYGYASISKSKEQSHEGLLAIQFLSQMQPLTLPQQLLQIAFFIAVGRTNDALCRLEALSTTSYSSLQDYLKSAATKKTPFRKSVFDRYPVHQQAFQSTLPPISDHLIDTNAYYDLAVYLYALGMYPKVADPLRTMERCAELLEAVLRSSPTFEKARILYALVIRARYQLNPRRYEPNPSILHLLVPDDFLKSHPLIVIAFAYDAYLLKLPFNDTSLHLNTHEASFFSFLKEKPSVTHASFFTVLKKHYHKSLHDAYARVILQSCILEHQFKAARVILEVLPNSPSQSSYRQFITAVTSSSIDDTMNFVGDHLTRALLFDDKAALFEVLPYLPNALHLKALKLSLFLKEYYTKQQALDQAIASDTAIGITDDDKLQVKICRWKARDVLMDLVNATSQLDAPFANIYHAECLLTLHELDETFTSSVRETIDVIPDDHYRV
eukprot:CAMPEP_0117419912 /NCGR_PEP_ID=MMETSP0758-20121206/1375_1 /TAXON_ID=63605 /ORGANISM="Percolomonas cosmopolitus, Strain AE-1 (ATCC 50343)" /LENGTH=1179 /DNA_ID=CAMNT_0005201253 /DNA_START=559 /DNA_END=4095 /DNA_ORIENTATION=+